MAQKQTMTVFPITANCFSDLFSVDFWLLLILVLIVLCTTIFLIVSHPYRMQFMKDVLMHPWLLLDKITCSWWTQWCRIGLSCTSLSPQSKPWQDGWIDGCPLCTQQVSLVCGWMDGCFVVLNKSSSLVSCCVSLCLSPTYPDRMSLTKEFRLMDPSKMVFDKKNTSVVDALRDVEFWAIGCA